jgi:hypothetical protein
MEKQMKWQGKCIQGHATKYDNVRAHTWKSFKIKMQKKKTKASQCDVY